MTLIESIKRLRFTFSKKNKPNDTDIEALNIVLKTINDYQQKGVDDNRVFAKLLCLYIKKEYQDGSNDINQTIEILGKDLKMPLEFHIDNLSNKILSTQLINFVATLRVDAVENELTTIEGIEKVEKRFWTENQNEIMDEIRFMNSKENIRNNFYMTANQILSTEIYRQ